MEKKLDGAMDVLPEPYLCCSNCGLHKPREEMVNEPLHSFCDFACRNAHRNHMAEKG